MQKSKVQSPKSKVRRQRLLTLDFGLWTLDFFYWLTSCSLPSGKRTAKTCRS